MTLDPGVRSAHYKGEDYRYGSYSSFHWNLVTTTALVSRFAA